MVKQITCYQMHKSNLIEIEGGNSDYIYIDVVTSHKHINSDKFYTLYKTDDDKYFLYESEAVHHDLDLNKLDKMVKILENYQIPDLIPKESIYSLAEHIVASCKIHNVF